MADFWERTKTLASDLASQAYDVIGPSEAEAFPIGKALKPSMIKKLSSELSRAVKLLTGTPFQGKTITNVTRGKRDMRYIHLDDEGVVPVTKDVIADMARKVGTNNYIDAFNVKEPESQLIQAMKSLEYHRKRRAIFGPGPRVKDQFKRYETQLTEAGLEAPPTSYVSYNGEKFSMPSEYADLLEREGVIKVIKRLK